MKNHTAVWEDDRGHQQLRSSLEPTEVQVYRITSITTMYRYRHQRNHLCSKIKLIISLSGHKQLWNHTETRNGKKLGDGSYPATKVPGICA